MYEAVIGLEIHAQLRTATKLFCGCRSESGGEPNTRTCPTCLGLPGALPVLNGRAVDQAVVAALTLGCTVRPLSLFARKNYFYPDLPKGYQITQYDQPLATDGRLAWEGGEHTLEVGIIRVHLEEDAGKSLHGGSAGTERVSGIDYNRAGVPLVEIVTAPDLRTPDDAAECFRQLRAALVEAGVTDGQLAQGNLRCDANVSLRRAGAAGLGARTEIKNLNSFRFLREALAGEIARQRAVLEAGGAVETATMLYDERQRATVPMRVKEDSGEYRYFPEPDLPPLAMTPGRIDRLRGRVPEPPEARRLRLAEAHGLRTGLARTLAASAALTRYFESIVAEGARAATAAQWVTGEVLQRLHDEDLDAGDVRVTAGPLARLIALVEDGSISATAAKRVFGRVWDTGDPVDVAVEVLGVRQVSDPAAMHAWVDAVLAAHADVVAQYRAGRRGALGFLVGQVIKASGGRANPSLADRLVRSRLDAVS